MSTATLAILVSITLATIWAGICTYMIARTATKALKDAQQALDVVDDMANDPTVFAPVYKVPSRRVATLRAINALADLNRDNTNDIEDVTAATVAA